MTFQFEIKNSPLGLNFSLAQIVNIMPIGDLATIKNLAIRGLITTT